MWWVWWGTFPPWISHSGFVCLSSWGLLLPIAPYHSAFLGAGGENVQEVAASSELPESKGSDTDHANLESKEENLIHTFI